MEQLASRPANRISNGRILINRVIQCSFIFIRGKAYKFVQIGDCHDSDNKRSGRLVHQSDVDSGNPPGVDRCDRFGSGLLATV